jgi:hypothetical protein
LEEWLTGKPEEEARALIAHLIHDQRVKPETRLRAAQYLLDHAHGRAKETVELDDTGPKYPEMDLAMLEAMLAMRRAALEKQAKTVLAKHEEPLALPQDWDGEEKS